MSASPKAKEWTAGLSASPLGENITGSIILRAAVFQEALAKVRICIGKSEKLHWHWRGNLAVALSQLYSTFRLGE
jgi:hypothetical protein